MHIYYYYIILYYYSILCLSIYLEGTRGGDAQSSTTMEDGVIEVQSLLPPLNLNPEDASEREDDEKKEDGKVEGVKQEDIGVEHTGKDGAAKDEGKRGLINSLISTLVSPLSPRTGKATEHESGNGVFNSKEGAADDGVDHGERGGVDNSGEGGLISNIVSNLFHQSGGEVVVENVKEKEDEEVMVDEKIKRVKTENGANNGGGGSIIHDIVSHLPPSLPGKQQKLSHLSSIYLRQNFQCSQFLP